MSGARELTEDEQAAERYAKKHGPYFKREPNTRCCICRGSLAGEDDITAGCHDRCYDRHGQALDRFRQMGDEAEQSARQPGTIDAEQFHD
jgi:hypothetical protein